MKRRLFVAINLSDRDKKGLEKKIRQWNQLPVFWSRNDNFHLTLLFLGYVDDQDLPELCGKIKKVTVEFNSFEVEFNRIGLVPDDRNPRMVWLKGEPSEDLRRIQEGLEKELDMFVRSKKEYRPHITLGRIRRKLWNSTPGGHLVQADYRMLLSVTSLDLMQSSFEDGCRTYTLLESCELKN